MNDVPEPTPPSPAPAFNLDDLRLLPDWMKADAPAPPGTARREDRRFDNYEDRGPGRGDQDFRRPPRPGGGGGGFRGGDSRGPRPGGVGGGSGGGGFREGRRDDRGPRPGGAGGGAPRDRRDDRRGGGGAPPPRRFEERPAPTRPAPVRVDFVPDPRPLAGIAKEIRSRHLAYPLFGLARMFLERPESHRIRLSAESTPPAKEGEKPGAPSPLFQLGPDGPVALSRATLENMAFDEYRERFYLAQSVQKDPPKGNFTSVARERGSGVLLGPPNHHSYQTNLRALYDSRYSRRMGFEEFRRGVEIINDPALVERWKEEVRTVTTYTVRATLPPEPPAKAEGAETGDVQPSAEASTAPGEGEIVTPAAEAAAPASEAVVTAAPESAPTPAAPEEAVADATPEVPAADAPKPVVFENLTDVRAHFREHYLEEIVRSGTRLELPGPAGRQLPEASLTLSLRLAHEQELRYPAGLVQPLRVGLQNTGLHIFKHRKRVVYVSAIRPTPFRTGGETGGAVSEGIAAILETITAQPMISGKDLATRVIARRLGPDSPAANAPKANPEPATPAPAPLETLETVAEPAAAGLAETAAPGVETTVPPAPVSTDPRQETIDRFKAHLAADLRYLIGAGHVIAFHNNTFDLPLPPRPKEPPKPVSKPVVTAKEAGKPPSLPAAGAASAPSSGETAPEQETPESPDDEGMDDDEGTVVEAASGEDAPAAATGQEIIADETLAPVSTDHPVHAPGPTPATTEPTA